MKARARSFLAANEISPVVYGSVDEGRVTYRLADGKIFRLNMEEARQAPNPKWAYLEKEMHPTALAEHRRDNAAILGRVSKEYNRLDAEILALVEREARG